MAFRQTRVFVRYDEPFDAWPETLIGRVFGPITSEFRGAVRWFWFSRYLTTEVNESGDCDIALIPDEYKQPLQADGPPLHRSLRFRFSIDDAQQAAFEARFSGLIDRYGYRISDFRHYDQVADAGRNRFLGNENRVPGRAKRRAEVVIAYLMSVSQLVIDALVGPDADGQYSLETNDDRAENPRGSTFQSLLHMFCNITNAPTDVYVFRAANDLIGLGTFMYPPPEPPGGWQGIEAVSIRY